MVLSKLNIQKLVSKHTRGRYTFQPLWVSADTLNKFYVSVNEDIPPLDATAIPAFLLAETCVLTIQPHEFCRKLLAVQPFKAQGPDNVPCRILKEFAYELVESVTTIVNASLASGIVPAIWKDSNITPIPKIQSPTNEGDFRPISLTSCLSKILEDFVVTWMIDDIRNGISSNLFGCLKGASTVFCLLDIMHTWLSYLYSPNKHLRLFFLDFSKAFDRIGHNVLIRKLVDFLVFDDVLYHGSLVSSQTEDNA